MKQSLQCLTAEDRTATALKKKPVKKQVKTKKKFSASSLLKYAGKWAGDDPERCLEEMYLVRGEAEFQKTRIRGKRSSDSRNSKAV